MTVRPAPRALTVIRDYDSGATQAHWTESRRAMSGSSLSARCKRLEENMLTNLSSLQTHRRGLEEVVQRRKEAAEQGKKELQEYLKNSRKSAGGGETSMLGLKPLNFVTMKERCAALEETVGQNQDTLMLCRSMLDSVGDKNDSGQVLRADCNDSADFSPSRIAEKLQAEADADITQEDITQMPEDREEQARAQAEARQRLLFGIEPSLSMATASAGRPSSAPAGSRVSRVPPYVRPPSAASGPSRPSSSLGRSSRPTSSLGHASSPLRPSSATRPVSAGSGGVLGGSLRPHSANSMRARMKVLEENVARNKKILTNNRDGLEVVKKRREQAAKAMAQLLVDLKPISSGG